MKKDTSKKEKLSETVDRVLAGYPALFGGDDTAARNDTKLFELLANDDEQLIALLAKNEIIREKFFINAGNRTVVFKREDFQFFVQENVAMHHGYTQYKNRIGLTDGKNRIGGGGDVVLNFPFKDCILEGGQSAEEGTDTYFEYEEQKTKKVKGKDVTQPAGFYQKQGKRAEIFFNSVIAADEIDMLLAPKALVNWKRYSKAGAGPVSGIARDADGTIKDNLIIKGNNLLALHSIKKQFAGKVKLIYIDPPYNTGNDSFKYNDRFNHSTWLTFMKNRLEVARELLREDGVIFVQCDDNEQAYLKVLMDEIFGRDNFLNNVSVRMSTSAGLKMSHKERKMLKIKESILVYVNSSQIFKICSLDDLYVEKSFYETERSDKYIVNFDESFENWTFISVHQAYKKFAKTDEPKFEFVNRNAKRIFNHVMNDSTKKSWNKLSENDKKIWRDKVRLYNVPNSDYKYAYNDHVFIPYNPKILEGDLWNKNFSIGGTKTHEGDAIFTQGKKREVLLKRIISIATNTNDIVLDFFMGSGTTTAVAHKMGRQYIGIEQMDYIETIAVERLKKVITGEQSGISKSVDWKGGGDFVYCELARYNQAAQEKIAACKNLRSLVNFFGQMCDDYFLCYNLKIKDFKKIIKEKQFGKLSLAEQKQMFAAMLDNNQLYVCQSEMADGKFGKGISTADRNLTNQFYALEAK